MTILKVQFGEYDLQVGFDYSPRQEETAFSPEMDEELNITDVWFDGANIFNLLNELGVDVEEKLNELTLYAINERQENEQIRYEEAKEAYFSDDLY